MADEDTAPTNQPPAEPLLEGTHPSNEPETVTPGPYPERPYSEALSTEVDNTPPAEPEPDPPGYAAPIY